MKKKIVPALAVCLAIFVIVSASFVIYDTRVMGRSELARSDMEHLAYLIESYREDHSKYPESLSVLETESEREKKKLVGDILHDREGLRRTLIFEYQPLTNGFIIGVKGIDSWRPSADTLRKEYKTGEALK